MTRHEKRLASKVRAKCHVDRPHCARGFCLACYMRDLRKRNQGIGEAERAWHRRDYLQNSAAIKTKVREYRQRTGYRRLQTLQGRGGMTLEQFTDLVERQQGLCAICRCPETGRPTGKHKSTNPVPLSVDHDHKTGLRRGLLCRRCNTLLGMAADDPQILLAAIDYLRAVRHQAS